MATKSRLIWTLVLMGFFVEVKAQYGPEWIDYDQTYFKLKVIQDGWYRVTGSQLEAAGFPLATVQAGRLQMFRRGEELAIHVVEHPDQTLDYLEFYGQRNDGAGDVGLYVEPSAQMHTNRSLFTDTATYFLTWLLADGPVKRIETTNLTDPDGHAAETYHLNELTTVLFNAYSPGLRFGSGASFTLADYDFAEGWTGTYRAKAANETMNFTLSNLTTGPDPSLEIVLVGGNSLGHRVDIQVGPNTSTLRTIGTVEFSGWGFTKATFSFLPSDVGAGGALVVRALMVGYDGAAERVSVAKVKVNYPQVVSMTTSENKAFYLREIASQDRALFSIATTNAANTRLFDITNPANILQVHSTPFADRLEGIVPNPQTPRKLFAVTNPLSVPVIRQSNFVNYDYANKDYLIITHPRLRLPASDAQDPVQAFATYRASIAGGQYSSVILDIRQVYDQYNYGDPSPMAISRLVERALDEFEPKCLFLIGKGRVSDQNYFRNAGLSTQVNIPTYGTPGSDLFFSVDRTTHLPRLPVGRINATTAEQVKSFVDKLKTHEALAYDQLWRKDLLHLHGGLTAAELTTFKIYANDFKTAAEGDFLGGKAKNIGKQTSEAVEYVDVVSEINAGRILVTLFGHSSGTVNDIEIGRVSSGAFGYNNTGKYPVILVNGCNAGDIFRTNFTFGEDWTLTANLGAVAFFSHSDFATALNLKRYSDLFYRIGFREEPWLGTTLGEMMMEISRRYYQNFGNSLTSRTQVQMTVLQGDPMMKLFGAEKPDYDISADRVWVDAHNGGPLLASLDSFRVNMIVRNYGRTSLDPLFVGIRRTLPGGEVIEDYKTFNRVMYQDTLTFTIYNEAGLDIIGTNTLTVFIDPANEVDELNESNNTVTTGFQVFRGNTAHLFPPDFSVYATPQIEFKWQPTDIFQPLRGYTIELDTVSTFNSPFFQTYQQSGRRVLTQQINFAPYNLPDTTVIYWRTRFSDAQNVEEQQWQQSSFTIIPGAPASWGQFERDQYLGNEVVGVEFEGNNKTWDFRTSDTPLYSVAFGPNYPGYNYSLLTLLVGATDLFVTSNTIDPTCKRTSSINAVVFDRQSTLPYRSVPIETTDVLTDIICGRIPQMIYNMNATDVTGANRWLDNIINNMAIGDHVLLFSMGTVNYSTWDATTRNHLETVGISSATIASLVNGQPVIMFGRKGDAPGTAIIVNNNGSGDPLNQQGLSLNTVIPGSFTSGRVKSGLIGPARSWQEFDYRLKEGPEDVVSVQLFGVTRDGNEQSLFSGMRTDGFDVSHIDATQYPWIKALFNFSDDTNLTPPQLDFWQVAYEQPAEAVLYSEDTDQKRLQEGQPIVWPFVYENVSTVDFSGEVDVLVTLRNSATGNIRTQELRLQGPQAGQPLEFNVELSSTGMHGLNNLAVVVTPIENERYAFNNQVTLVNAVFVEADRTNPLMDVTFDGQYILNGDIVSPDPTIVVRLRDDNPFLKKLDTLGMEIQLRKPCSGCTYERIYFSNPLVNYSAASEANDFEITLHPGPLEDGLHSLRIQASDAAGNAAGSVPYEIAFEVINASTITHFYPYPNPFSTQTRFVFTLTGSKIPERIKIQIMTVSGRIVREINQEEIGPIHIGHNITQFAWDGTDEYGDKLANGVYFYRVQMDNSGERMSHRTTRTDGAFKNGFGKLYILR
jgi:hypothetical protein